MKGRKLHDLELLLYMTVRSSFFSIQNSDEYFIYLTGYRIGKKSKEIDDFYKFLIKDNLEFNFEKRNLPLVISFLSVYKCNSLELLRSLLIRFLEKKETENLKLVKNYMKKNSIEKLIKNYSKY